MMIGTEPPPRDRTRRGLLHALPAGLLALDPATLNAFDIPPVGTGWREALVVVADAKIWIDTLTRLGGWEVSAAGAFDDALNGLWRLPATARTRQTVMRNIGAVTGFIRLVEVVGVDQKRIRQDDQAWETGGLSALDIRVVDLEGTRAALEARGWRAPAEPIRYGVYGVEVIQWAPTSPDGVRLSFIQRLSPPLVGWTELKRWSRVTNAAIVTRDLAEANGFYRDTLALVQMSRATVLGTGGPNVLGLPWPVAEHLSVDIRGFAGPIPGGGAIELISIPAVEGRDHSADAHPPNLGIAGLRFVVPDLSRLRRRLEAHGVAVFAPNQPIVCAPYGACSALVARVPDGVWLEFIQLSKSF